jgi:hypothetical protein
MFDDDAPNHPPQIGTKVFSSTPPDIEEYVSAHNAVAHHGVDFVRAVEKMALAIRSEWDAVGPVKARHSIEQARHIMDLAAERLAKLDALIATQTK